MPSGILGRTLAARALKLKGTLGDYLKRSQLQAQSDEQREKARDIEKGIADLNHVLKVATVYSMVTEIESGYGDATLELSAIVCLDVGDRTMIDVARFGDFGAPKRNRARSDGEV